MRNTREQTYPLQRQRGGSVIQRMAILRNHYEGLVRGLRQLQRRVLQRKANLRHRRHHHLPVSLEAGLSMAGSISILLNRRRYHISLRLALGPSIDDIFRILLDRRHPRIPVSLKLRPSMDPLVRTSVLLHRRDRPLSFDLDPVT